MADARILIDGELHYMAEFAEPEFDLLIWDETATLVG
jgi:hypothetical protein